MNENIPSREEMRESLELSLESYKVNETLKTHGKEAYISEESINLVEDLERSTQSSYLYSHFYAMAYKDALELLGITGKQ